MGDLMMIAASAGFLVVSILRLDEKPSWVYLCASIFCSSTVAFS